MEELTDGDYCSLALIDTDEEDADKPTHVIRVLSFKVGTFWVGAPEDQWNKVSLDANKRLRDTSLAVTQLHLHSLPLLLSRRDEVINYVLPIVGPGVALLGDISELSSCRPLFSAVS